MDFTKLITIAVVAGVLISLMPVWIKASVIGVSLAWLTYRIFGGEKDSSGDSDVSSYPPGPN